MPDSDYICDLVVDHVMELLGKRYRKSQIKIELAKLLNNGKPLKLTVVNKLINLARKKIRELYKIDSTEYMGCSIEFYSSILRDERASLKYKLTANENLDKLLGLENISNEDPEEYASKLREAMKIMDGTIQGKDLDDDGQTQFQTQSSKDSNRDSLEEDSEEAYDEPTLDAVKNVEMTENGLEIKSLKS